MVWDGKTSKSISQCFSTGNRDGKLRRPGLNMLALNALIIHFNLIDYNLLHSHTGVLGFWGFGVLEWSRRLILNRIDANQSH